METLYQRVECFEGLYSFLSFCNKIFLLADELISSEEVALYFYTLIVTGTECNVRYDGNSAHDLVSFCHWKFGFLFVSFRSNQLSSPMETNTFSLDEIRRELTRLGYDGLSKQTLAKFQQDLEELAQNEKSQSKVHETSLRPPIDSYRYSCTETIREFSTTIKC